MEYQITRKEIRIIDKDFRRYASRLLKTKYGNEIKDLTRFLNYIEEQPLIRDFIEKKSTEQFDIKLAITNKGWNDVYDIPVEKDREITWVYQLLNYTIENYSDFWAISQGYSHSRTIQDHIDAFCHEVIKPFVDHITDYIGEVMIEMGIDENAKINIQITSGNGQVNVASDTATINAVNNVNMTTNDIKQIIELADKFIEMLRSERAIEPYVKESLLDDIDVIKEQVVSEIPKIPRLKKALSNLGGIQGALTKGTGIMNALNSLIIQGEKFIQGLKVLGNG